MKKLFTFLIVSLMLITLGFSQTTLFEDDFESLTPGEKFVQQANQDWWDTWSNDPGGDEDPYVSTDYANSGSNSVVYAGVNDVILKLGDRASGEYEVIFYIYVETGQGGGYFNLQKWEDPGSEWAFNGYFYDDGTGFLEYNTTGNTFTYDLDQWVEVKSIIDLDNDIFEMYIDGVLVDTHQYSMQAFSATGEKRLGCINFYGGTSVDPYDFYIDDVSVIEVTASTPPVAGLDITEIITDGTANSTFNISNNGVEDLLYSIYPTYTSTSVKGENKQIILNNSKDNADLTYIAGNVGYYAYLFDGLRTMKEVIKITPEKLTSENAVGMYLNSVICYIGETSYIETVGGDPVDVEFKLKVWDRGTLLTPGPGNLITEQVFAATSYDQNVVTLDSPIYIDGRDLWFGFEYYGIGMIENVDTLFTLSRDDGTVVPDVNFISSGVGWQEEDGGNLGIIGLASGDPVIRWLSASPSTGSIVAADSDEITVSFDLTDLSTGTYTSTLVVSTNDPTNTFNEIPVTLNAVIIGVNSIENSGIMTFPNPATDIFTIVSDTEINIVKIMDLTGKLIQEVTPNSNSYKFDLSNLSKGVYIFNISTANQSVSRKIIVE
ncbi:MAG: T9SS type A sorting domain-containing protein [Bacteroidales bacterium]|nr:T9SS type A sorting domain-containing protein [Bacteroidales bacterium]